MSRSFAIGCLHLGHNRILELENRPFSNVDEMACFIHACWSMRVKPEDTVYVLGDVSLYKTRKYVKDFFESLPGKKILVLGNHDRWGKAAFQACGFSAVHKRVDTRHAILTHKPIDQPSGVNIHAHTHSKPHSAWHINVSAEAVDYSPMDITELL